MAREYGIQSQGDIIVSSGITTVQAWMAMPMHPAYKNVPEPVIEIRSSGNFDSVLTQYDPNIDKPEVILYACALPSGTTAPTSSTDMVSNYCSFAAGGYGTFLKKTDLISHVFCTQQTPGTTSTTRLPISGNAYYDIYAAHVLSIFVDGSRQNITYGDLCYLIGTSGVRTQAPYVHTLPDDPDFTVAIADEGLVLGTQPCQTFTFTFADSDNIYNFSELTDSIDTTLSSYDYDLPAANLASSGYVQMLCSGRYSKCFYDPIYDGVDPTDNVEAGKYQYLMPNSGSIVWKIPKFSEETDKYKSYETYDFYMRYIDITGGLSKTMQLTYLDTDLKALHETSLTTSDTLKVSDSKNWNGPNVIEVKGVTNRKRLAIGIQDIDLQTIEYKDTGSRISVPFGTEEPIYAISLDATEQAPQGGDLPIWNYIKYYLQFGGEETAEYHRISPICRSNETDEQGTAVPNVIILDTQMTEDDKKSVGGFNIIKFVDYGKPIYTVRVKVDLSTSISQMRGMWSPFVYDYKLMVINRKALQGNLAERYLFS